MKRVIVIALVAALVIALMPLVAVAKPDKDKPLPATNIELVKKVTLHGRPQGGGKPSKYAATGNLGDLCAGNKYAIVIGISDYPGAENDLEYSDDDATEVYDALTTLYGYKSTNVRLLIDMGASFDKIEEAISDIRTKEAGGDEVVFFFSGHGARGLAMDNDKEKIDEAIVIHDGNQNGSLVYIWDGQLREWFGSFNTTRIVFIFDTCLAGGMTDLNGSGRIINMATTEGGTAYEDDQWGNGQFTYYFVDEGMLQGNADKYDNLSGIVDVTVEEAFDYAKANCVWQKPTIKDSFEGDLLL
jgi:hypothetical protein